MALTSVTLESFDFDYRVIGSTAAHVDLGDAWIIGYQPEHLEKLAEKLMEAASALRIAEVRAADARSLSHDIEGNDVTAEEIAANEQYLRDQEAERYDEFLSAAGSAEDEDAA